MGKMRQTRRAMTFAGHEVGHVTGRVDTMKCKNCGQAIPVASIGALGVVPQCKIRGEIPVLSQVVEVLVPEEGA